MATVNAVRESPLPWIDITPSRLWRYPNARKTMRWVVRALIRSQSAHQPLTPDALRSAGVARARKAAGRVTIPLVFYINVLCDLRAQGWTLRLTRGKVLALAPTNGLEATEEKTRIRAAHAVDRDIQLQQPSVRRFVEEMERRRLHKREWFSIFSLMRDGRELADRLTAAVQSPGDSLKDDALRAAIDPYIQVARSGGRCAFTGLDLLDIWRYFRHTWSTTYQSTPGRKVFFLVRDRAAANHPVIGIAALGSPIVQLSVRDRWIGWTPDQVLAAMRESTPAPWVQWLERSLQRLIDTVYAKDLIKEGYFRSRDLRLPSEEAIEKLKALAATERRVHHLYPEQRQHKAAGGKRAALWSRQAQTHLFRSKRAAALADLLKARLELRTASIARPSSSSWAHALDSAGLKGAISTILRYTKAAHVGVEVMDITVCGAIAPYNHLLGGKLVSLLMASPEVRSEYARRYKTASSIIASSMAGRAIVRPPRLVLLGTTSLYGIAPSQYNRLKVPAAAVGGVEAATLAFECLGRTAGYGSYHFSRETLAALEPLLGRLQRGRPVNSIFGEGVNPKLRKVRAALDAVGLPSNLLLQHGSPRLVYGIALASNFREILLGLKSRPTYVIPARRDATARIIDFWRARWLSHRVENREVMRAVAEHSLISPVQHGARVVMPSNSREDTLGDTELGQVPTSIDDSQVTSPFSSGDTPRGSFEAIDVYDEIVTAAFARR
jgi:Domain of unknown function (DUF4338)